MLNIQEDSRVTKFTKTQPALAANCESSHPSHVKRGIFHILRGNAISCAKNDKIWSMKSIPNGLLI
jgi:hypothetical protein